MAITKILSINESPGEPTKHLRNAIDYICNPNKTRNGKLVGTKKGEKVFKFQITMEPENKLEVIAGECKDSAVIYKTNQPRPEYRMAKGNSSNWM